MARVKQHDKVQHRRDLADFCNRRGVVEAAEIGVHQAQFACEFLERWESIGHLMLIDPWETYENMPWRGREADFQLAVAEIARRGFSWRVIFMRERSPDVIRLINPVWHLHFAYIDACHLYEAVKADIEGWWARLDPGGILAGHDYEHFDHGDVTRAVNEFADARGLTIWTTREEGFAHSWILEKPI
jgi:hypothetical protein